ncbi:hypothetical protein CCHL11_06984 [Colletotrichum chlorophyti]|uniref:SnoaL-like domain-containing protein n=1 Tax=Colletotrichum chlorophyti TaxID=708187 RepID=A0A1Q8RC35_9PEZI|nr:hypothetical protein CCHL11_06984 [Colletotrichum chlorophyti]
MDGNNLFKDLLAVTARAWKSRDPRALLSLFALDTTMTDHDAHIHNPSAFLERHQEHWNGFHEDFEVYLDDKYPVYWTDVDRAGNEYCSFRTVNRGVFLNDVGRREATGLPSKYSSVTG